MFMSQEKLQTMSMQNFWGVKEVHYGIVQVVNGNNIAKDYQIYKQLVKKATQCNTELFRVGTKHRKTKLELDYNWSFCGLRQPKLLISC